MINFFKHIQICLNKLDLIKRYKQNLVLTLAKVNSVRPHRKVIWIEMIFLASD